MSDVPTAAVPAAEAQNAEATVAAISTNADVTAEESKDFVDAPSKPEDAAEVTAAAPVAEEAAPVEAPVAEAAAEKTVEPITEGLLAWKGPGFVKSIIPTKKNFWLSDEAVSAENLDLYLRGEKPEIAHAVVAWASQTGKGLLFANKKNETDRTHPADVFALYDATDLKKQSPHEFSFKLNGHNHTFKATSDAERDGWYLSIEKATELGKASKEEITESEAYKAELEKLSKPATVVAAAKRSQSQPKKSLDADKATAERAGSVDGTEEADKKQKKSRSTSRGMFNRLKGKKDEAEQKVAEKKEEKEAEKEEKEAEEPAPVAESSEVAPVAAAVAAAEVPAAAEATEASETKPVEETAATEEKPSKASKRNSIFGRVTSTWSGIRSPAKEKEQKDAELKPEDASKEAPVSENPPVLPETATTEPVVEPAVPAVAEPEVAAEAPKEETASPTKEKKNFLSGLGFAKRGRSVSPSTNLKDAAKTEEVPATEEAAEPAIKVEEPATEAGAEATTEAEKPAEEAAEEPKTETTTANKRQSVLGSLGRRASKALRGFQAPKKEASAASGATEATKEEETAVAKGAEEPAAVNESKAEETTEQQQSIGDVVPDAVNVGQPQPTVTPVTASA